MAHLSIHDIKDSRTRDLLRGLLDRTAKPPEVRATLGKLLASVNRTDFRTVDGLLRTDQLFRHLEILPEFPTDAPFQGNRGALLIPRNGLSLEYVAYRIHHNEERVCKGLALLRELNQAIQSGLGELAVVAIGNVVDEVGHSLTLARKAAFIIGYAPKESIAHPASVELVSSYGINGNNYGMMATIDTIAADFNYLDLKYRFREYAGLDRPASPSRKISALCFSPVSTEAEHAAAIVEASYQISLIDATIALLCHREQEVLSIDLPGTVEAEWDRLRQGEHVEFAYFRSSGVAGDSYAFRSAPAFLEYERFRRLRYALQPLYDLPEARAGTESSRYAAAFFKGVEKVVDLLPEGKLRYDVFPREFDRETAGTLSRSCGLVWVCDRDPDFSEVTTESMASLMGSTSEMDRLLSPDVLRRAAGTATDPFVRLILHTLLRANSSATRDSYAFKEEFQRYVRAYHGGDILDFMARVRTLDDRIIQYFVNLLDETLLSQMAFLMESSNAIYETRARLLEWYSDVANDGGTRDKAKQLRLDRKIASVRGVINETRLNIDSVRFRQWIEQNKLTDFSDFIRQAAPNLPSIVDLVDSSKTQTRFLAAHREPTTLALQSLVQCYDEFCRNPDYGIASFLGRRIRHGTLRGTLLNGIPEPARVELPPAATSQYNGWAREFSTAINALTGRLYFRSKSSHKDGLLSAEVDSQEKWQICVVCLQQIYDRAQHDNGVLFAPLLIEQACWLIFESELKKVRAFIGEARSKWGTLKLRYHPNEENVLAFEKQTNITLSDQFSTVMSWFRKPPNISPIAELSHVIQVVLQEARDEYPAFEPETQFTGEPDLTLNGATYYVVYDALTIAVRNAAKHGKHPGSITISAKVEALENVPVLVINVTSLLKDTDCAASALNRIEEAGRAGPTNADIVEGGTGIRKLKKMATEKSIVGFKTCDVPETNQLCVSIVFPYAGIVP